MISMTDGKIEKIGWLPLGGYRIGIRSPHGGYFYYAHLASYEKYFQTGEAVEAGRSLDSWEIPDTEKKECPENFRFIFIWEST